MLIEPSTNSTMEWKETFDTKPFITNYNETFLKKNLIFFFKIICDKKI